MNSNRTILFYQMFNEFQGQTNFSTSDLPKTIHPRAHQAQLLVDHTWLLTNPVWVNRTNLKKWLENTTSNIRSDILDKASTTINLTHRLHATEELIDASFLIHSLSLSPLQLRTQLFIRSLNNHFTQSSMMPSCTQLVVYHSLLELP